MDGPDHRSSIGRRELHISIGTSPTGEIDLRQELRLVKAALLYADRVRLYSLTASMMQMVSRLGDLNTSQQLELFEMVVPYLASRGDAEELIQRFRQYRRVLRQRTTRSYKDRQLKIGFQRILAQYSNDIKDEVVELAKDAKADSLDLAVESGLLQLHAFEGTEDDKVVLQFVADCVARASGSPLAALEAHEMSERDDKLIKEFVERVCGATLDGTTYPLFDGGTGELIRALVHEKGIDVPESGVTRGKHSGLAGHLLQRLPLFDEASVDEILDIRQELDKPLTRFRGAIIQFCENIRSAQWDRDFPSDAEEVFYRDVGPAILDIEEAVKSNKLLSSILRKFVDEPVALLPGSIFSIVLSQFSSMPDEIALSLGIAISSAAIVYDAYDEWKEKQREIEKNQLYFYHQAQKKLSR